MYEHNGKYLGTTMTKTYPTLLQLIMAMVLSVLSTALAAQVYETTDEEGNPVFSDTPSPGASEVEIQAPNTAKSVEVRPQQPSQAKRVEPAKSSASNAPEQAERLDPYLIHSDEDNRRRHDQPEHRPGDRPDRPTTQPIKTARPAHRR